MVILYNHYECCISKYWIIVFQQNTELDSYKPLITFLSTDQYVTLFFVGFCFKKTYFVCVYVYVLNGVPGGSMVKNSHARQMWVQSLGWEDPLGKEMTTHSSVLAWKIPWREEPWELQSRGHKGVRHNLVTEHTHTYVRLYTSVRSDSFRTEL